MTIIDINIEKWKAELDFLDKQIEPIATKPVDFDSLDAGFEPSEESIIADVNFEAQSTIRELVECYISGDDTLRKVIRELFRKYTSFSWAVSFKPSDDSESEVLRNIAFLSIQDQGADARDFIMHCSSIFEKYQESATPYKKELELIVNISSNENIHGMGTTASILRKWC